MNSIPFCKNGLRICLSICICLSVIFLPHVLFAYETETEFARRAADESFDALMNNFWEAPRGDFVGNGNYWFYAHSIDIAVLAATRAPVPKNLDRLKLLIQQQARRGFLQGQSVYFDDENWMALALVRAAKITNDPNWLKTSVQLFEDIMTRGTQGLAEGIWWNYERAKRATASNAGPVITGVLLWNMTGDLRFLNFAKKTYAYWLREMASPLNHQDYDQIFPDGKKDQTPFSYDQGLMIGAALQLYSATHDPSYLLQAKGFAQYMLDNMKSTGGVMLEQVCITHRAECLGWKDVAQFKGIGFRYLAELLKVDPSQDKLHDYLKATAHSMMSPQVFDPKTGRFAYEWDGSEPATTGSYQTTNSAALALAAYADLF